MNQPESRSRPRDIEEKFERILTPLLNHGYDQTADHVRDIRDLLIASRSEIEEPTKALAAKLNEADAARYRWLRQHVTYRDQETLSLPAKYYYRRWFHDTSYKVDTKTIPEMFDASIDAGMNPNRQGDDK